MDSDPTVFYFDSLCPDWHEEWTLPFLIYLNYVMKKDYKSLNIVPLQV